MSLMGTRWMEIAFAKGWTLKFRFAVQATGETVVQLLEEALKLPTLTIRADDKPYVIQASAINTITVSPAPKKLPRTVIRGATLA
jgi:hypothetical protein